VPSSRPRKGSPGIKPSIDEIAATRLRDLEILRLATNERLNGIQIADRLGIDKSAVSRALQRIWARNESPLVEQQRAIQNANIAAMVAAYLPKALDGDTKAAIVVLRYLEREARLNGLDQQAASDAAGFAALLADPEATKARIMQMRDEIAEARARREAAGQ